MTLEIELKPTETMLFAGESVAVGIFRPRARIRRLNVS